MPICFINTTAKAVTTTNAITTLRLVPILSLTIKIKVTAAAASVPTCTFKITTDSISSINSVLQHFAS